MAQLKMGQRAAIERVTKAALQEPRRRQLDPLSPRIAALDGRVDTAEADIVALGAVDEVVGGTITIGTTAPSSPVVNDVWIDTT